LERVELGFRVDALRRMSNTPPMMSGIGPVTENEDAADTEIDLTAAFADIQTAETGLTYTIELNTNPTLVTATPPILGGTMPTLAYTGNRPRDTKHHGRATDPEGGFVETTFTVTVNAMADDSFLRVTTPASGDEGAVIPLTITTALVDTDGSESGPMVRISGLPTTGVSFSSGTNLSGGVWEFTAAELVGLTVTFEDNYGTDTATSPARFRVFIGAGQTATIKLYSYAPALLTAGLAVSVEGGPIQTLGAGTVLTVTGTAGEDGILDPAFSRPAGKGFWTLNGMEVTLQPA
jgi:hypothetical protein